MFRQAEHDRSISSVMGSCQSELVEDGLQRKILEF